MVMRGVFSTSEGRVTYRPPLDEAKDAEKLCPHCYGRLHRAVAPTILPPPWFDHGNRQVIVGDERRQIPGGQVFRLLIIFWERQERVLSTPILMDLMYGSTPNYAPQDAHVLTVFMWRLRKLLDGTPYSII